MIQTFIRFIKKKKRRSKKHDFKTQNSQKMQIPNTLYTLPAKAASGTTTNKRQNQKQTKSNIKNKDTFPPRRS